MQYGILIGRFQPLHKAHQAIIDEIMHDGLTPVIFIGSSNTLDDKNPFSYAERASMMHEIYGGEVATLPLPDVVDNDAQWSKNVFMSINAIGIKYDECRLYYYHKEGDYNIKPLLSYFEHRQPSYPDIFDKISASNIRKEPEKYKAYLDGRILKYLTSK